MRATSTTTSSCPSQRAVPPDPGRAGRVVAAQQRLDSEAYFFRACGGVDHHRGAKADPQPDLAAHSLQFRASPRLWESSRPGVAFLAFPFFLFILARAEPLILQVLLPHRPPPRGSSSRSWPTLLLSSFISTLPKPTLGLPSSSIFFFQTSLLTCSWQALSQRAGVRLTMAARALAGRQHPAQAPSRTSSRRAFHSVTGPSYSGDGPSRAVPSGSAHSRDSLCLHRAAISVTPLLVYNALAFGNPLGGYGTKPFDTSPLVSLYGLLFSPSRGLFIYEPYMVFAFATVVLLKPGRDSSSSGCSRCGMPRPRRRSSTPPTSMVGWARLGPRFLDDLAPVLFALLAWGIGHGLLARWPAKILFWSAPRGPCSSSRPRRSSTTRTPGT